MKILVTGANGQLGREMRIVSRDTNHEFVFTDVVEAEGVQTTRLDITDLEAVRRTVREEQIDCIVNCAAYTNVDKAESDEAFCRVLNAEAPRNLAQAMKEVNGLLIHISTDYVLAGIPTIRLAGRTKKVLRPESTDRPSLKESSIFSAWVASMSFFVPPGSIPNLAETLSRRCSTSRRPNRS